MKNALGSVAVLLLLCSVPPPLIGKDCVALASRPCPVWAQLGRLPMRMRGGGRRTQLFSGEQAMPATATDRGSRRGRGRSLARSHSPSTEGLWRGEAPVEGDEFTQYGQKTAMGAVEIGAEGDEEAGQEGLGSERAGVAGSPTFLQDTESEQGAVGGEIRTMADVLDELGINANLRRREERELERQRAGGHAPEIAREMGLSDPSEDNPDGNHVAELVRFASQSDSGFTSWGGFSGLDMNRLYWGVRYFGTDFDVMQLALFPNRTRAELKRKYALERRRRPWLMDHALENPLEVSQLGSSSTLTAEEDGAEAGRSAGRNKGRGQTVGLATEGLAAEEVVFGITDLESVWDLSSGTPRMLGAADDPSNPLNAPPPIPTEYVAENIRETKRHLTRIRLLEKMDRVKFEQGADKCEQAASAVSHDLVDAAVGDGSETVVGKEGGKGVAVGSNEEATVLSGATDKESSKRGMEGGQAGLPAHVKAGLAGVEGLPEEFGLGGAGVEDLISWADARQGAGQDEAGADASEAQMVSDEEEDVEQEYEDESDAISLSSDLLKLHLEKPWRTGVVLEAQAPSWPTKPDAAPAAATPVQALAAAARLAETPSSVGVPARVAALATENDKASQVASETDGLGIEAEWSKRARELSNEKTRVRRRSASTSGQLGGGRRSQVVVQGRPSGDADNFLPRTPSPEFPGAQLPASPALAAATHAAGSRDSAETQVRGRDRTASTPRVDRNKRPRTPSPLPMAAGGRTGGEAPGRRSRSGSETGGTVRGAEARRLAVNSDGGMQADASQAQSDLVQAGAKQRERAPLKREGAKELLEKLQRKRQADAEAMAGSMLGL